MRCSSAEEEWREKKEFKLITRQLQAVVDGLQTSTGTTDPGHGGHLIADLTTGQLHLWGGHGRYTVLSAAALKASRDWLSAPVFAVFAVFAVVAVLEQALAQGARAGARQMIGRAGPVRGPPTSKLGWMQLGMALALHQPSPVFWLEQTARERVSSRPWSSMCGLP